MTRTNLPDPQQYALDFQSREDERRRILRTLEFPAGARFLKVRFLLELLANEPAGELTCPHRELAQRMSQSVRGLIDTIRDALYLKAVVAEERKRPDGSRAANSLRVNWSGLVNFLPGRSAGPVILPPGRRQGDADARGGGASRRPRVASSDDEEEDLDLAPPANPAGGSAGFAPPPANPAGGSAGFAPPSRKKEERSSSVVQENKKSSFVRSSWKKEEGRICARLLKAGVGATRQALHTARHNGLSPSDVDALIDHYVPINARYPGYGPGALYQAIVHAFPGQPPANFFVAIPDDVRKRESSARAAAEMRDKHRQDREQAAAEAERARQMEAQYGPILDAMPPEERAALAAEVLPSILQERAEKSPDSPLVRETLIGALAARERV